MEGLITNAKNFLNSDEGKKLAQSAGFGGDNSNSDNQNNQDNTNNQGGSTDAFGNQGQEGQYGQQGQYGAVTGQGFGGGLAKGRDGQQLPGQGQGQSGNSGIPGQQGSEGQWGATPGNEGGGVNPAQRSNYEGWSGEDSTTSGDYGGNPFSRAAQMGADDQRKEPVADDYDQGEGYKTGTSTPGYRHDDDVDALAAENRAKNADSRNFNSYGQQADDSGSRGNDYNEQI